MINTIQVAIILMFFSCSIKQEIGNKETKSDCQKAMSIFEEELLSSCPISKGVETVIDHLENYQGFKRNEKSDVGNGSVRFNAKDASIYGFPVVDERSFISFKLHTKFRRI